MKLKDFISVCDTSVIQFTIVNVEYSVVDFFTINFLKCLDDSFHDRVEKLHKYGDTTVIQIWTLNDVIRVKAKLIDRSMEDEKVFEA